MTAKPASRRIRWLARVWSLLIFAFTIMRVITPDPYATGSVSTEDVFLLGLWGIAILGVLVAWKWETAGAVITIGTLFFREAVWVVLKGSWLPAFLLVWAVLVPPVLLFLVAHWFERKPLTE